MTTAPAPARRIAAWSLIAASIAGVAHRRSGRGNDDAFACASRRDGALLLAVADGAGSAACAAAGARLVVDEALAALAAPSPAGWGSRCAAAVSRARGRLDTRARQGGRSLRDYACTLLLLEVGPAELRVGQIGDGAVVVRRGGETLRPTSPVRGRYAGETVFVTGADALRTLQIAEFPAAEVDAVALLSDGLEPVALQNDAPFAPFFDPLFRFAAGDGAAAKSRQLADFLAGEEIARRSHDDLTLLLAVRG